MSAAAPLTAKELEEIEEYEKIVKFAEDVRAGRHPGIKPKLVSPNSLSNQQPPPLLLAVLPWPLVPSLAPALPSTSIFGPTIMRT